MANCADGAACKDTLYGYKCVCPPSTYTHGDARKIPCSDVDECKDWKNCVAKLEGHSDVHPGVCVNFYGGYNCECVPGYFKFYGEVGFAFCYKNPSECDRKPLVAAVANADTANELHRYRNALPHWSLSHWFSGYLFVLDNIPIQSAILTVMLPVEMSLVATNVNVREDIKVTTRIAKMKMSAVLEDINAVHMRIAQTQWVLTSANVK
ncbi:hypothetical protein P5673_019951 [Acropora cervicornis]|uniref:EGF-like calcium-binding domain-containing protein n=1 Tax=Acropora cervicornis TaxID=6130 RepID=A0AAD9V196_ACRCE|nr:hypothetical protein P5673_019951 [Acropora cervicornis]